MMIVQATKRLLGRGAVLRGLSTPGMKQESIAGSWVSRRSIFQSTVPMPQMRPPERRPNPQRQMVMDFMKKMDAMLNEELARKGRPGYFETVWNTEKEEPDEYLEYVKSLSEGGLFRPDLRQLFDGCVERQWKGVEEYEPWRQLLQTLFPPDFGYDVTLEKVLKHTHLTAEQPPTSVVKVEDWFLVVRQQTDHGRYVRLLACGFDDCNEDPTAETGLHRLPYRLEPMACGFFQSGEALMSLPFLSFCATMFTWGHIFRISSLRMIGPDGGHVQRECGMRSLGKLAQLVNALQFGEAAELEDLRDWQGRPS